MIDPHRYEPGYTSLRPHPSVPRKVYRPSFRSARGTQYGRRVFKRANDALNCAQAIHARWLRLYDAAVALAEKEANAAAA